MNKKTLIVTATAITLSLGGAGIASASTTTATNKISHKTVSHSVGSMTPGVDPIASVLATLVSNGTITAAQSTAITNALAAARPTTPPNGPLGGGRGFGGFGGGISPQDQAVVLSTLGITAATLQSDLKAGQSLATIAGTKTQALITALVAAETTAINAQVTAGKLTQAQATMMIAGLTARVTAQVNAVPGSHIVGQAPLGTGANQ
jgi:hypothetical protein